MTQRHYDSNEAVGDAGLDLGDWRFSPDAMWAEVSSFNLLKIAPTLQMPVFLFPRGGRSDHWVPGGSWPTQPPLRSSFDHRFDPLGANSQPRQARLERVHRVYVQTASGYRLPRRPFPETKRTLRMEGYCCELSSGRSRVTTVNFRIARKTSGIAGRASAFRA